MHKSRFSRLALGAAILVCVLATRPALASTASALIEEFHASLVAMMTKADQLQLKERYLHLAPRVLSIFNIPFMMQAVTGRHWPQATEEERAGLVEAFARVSILTYASRIESYGGERFEILGERDAPNDRQLVLTHLVRPDVGIIPITYVVEGLDDRRRVVDIVFGGGISEVALKRSEYRRILDQGGITALTGRLNEAADQILARAPEPVAIKTSPSSP